MKQIKLLLFRKRRRKQKIASSKRSKFTDQTRHCQAQNFRAYYDHEQATSSRKLLWKAAILDLAFLNLFIYILNQEKTRKNQTNVFGLLKASSSSSSFEGYPLQARHKQNWGRGFILLLPQTVTLAGSDAGSDVIKPASSFVIQNRQTPCSMWCPMYGARCQYMVCGLL